MLESAVSVEVLQGVLIAVLAAPAVVTALACAAGRRRPRWTARIATLSAGLGFLGAAVLATNVTVGDAVSVTAGGGVVAVSADRLSVVLLCLVFGISALVQSFGIRYLAGDPKAARFTAGANLVTAASAGLVASATLFTLAVFWTAAGIALCLLLAMYPDLPAARDGVVRTAKAFFVGDLALWTAVALITARWGSVDLRTLAERGIDGTAAATAAVLIVVAALSRSAQLPFVRWLPATLAAPTPVSALLHAGVVNAGGVLLVKLSPLLAGADIARALTILAAAGTVVYGAMVMLVKPDVKGALAHSTIAQMGFMVLACGLGLSIAAVLHLVAHGFYKARLFLASGSAVAEHRGRSALPPAPVLTRRRHATIAVTAAMLSGSVLVIALLVTPLPKGADEAMLMVFAWATAAAATLGWLRRRPTLAGTAAAAAFLAPATFGYLLLVSSLSRFLTPAVPEVPAPTPTVWALLAVIVALAGLAVLRTTARRGGSARLQRVLYAHALSAGHVAAPSAHRPPAMTGASS
ncbi:proton-conducting transporter transmembrane domain-containing protein [Mycobacterium sp. IDR2000157661]|uniref:proton-conducting transporter transmembrane domain-containing protein n=1 Tax=Mycobacterium sp. IDR2000157661 TaxID=2867005 RepID=UPI001EEB6BAB|nr:proton-conducting transporter membrane subunit [Mycobacterium sp. IDR2000157661]ULE32061.1 hypothetical protein K3G64_18115 [Mycobacterium sp. IDR2000157661]